MRIRPLVLGFIVLVAVVTAAPNLLGHGDDDRGRRGDVNIAVLDDCDPDDAAWAAVGGCSQDKGDVTLAEFQLFNVSPLYDTDLVNPDPLVGRHVVGHPAWRNEPSHVVIKEGRKIRVKNEGGRNHTFTEVAEFGAGRAPNAALNRGLVLAAENGCALAPGTVDPAEITPGERLKITAGGVGIHKFQCCFHPWMRATIRVVEKNEHDH